MILSQKQLAEIDRLCELPSFSDWLAKLIPETGLSLEVLRQRAKAYFIEYLETDKMQYRAELDVNDPGFLADLEEAFRDTPGTESLN